MGPRPAQLQDSPAGLRPRVILGVRRHISQKECTVAHVVKTGSGRIRGVHEEGVLSFRGIPYAQPPIGPLRFRPPQKPLAWGGVRDACSCGPAPMQAGNPVASQMGLVPPEVSEDCLYLNVWTPAADGARRPVGSGCTAAP